MPTIIDSLIITLGLDNRDFAKQAQDAQESVKGIRTSVEAAASTQIKGAATVAAAQKVSAADTAGAQKSVADSATRNAKEMEARGKQAASYFNQIKTQALGLTAVLLGGRSVGGFMTNTAAGMNALGNAAHSLGMSAADLQVFRNAVAANGGSAEAAQGSITGLANAMWRLSHLGDTAIVPFLQRIGGSASDTPLQIMQRFHDYAVAHQNDPNDIRNVGAMGGLDPDSINELSRPSYNQDLGDARTRVATPEQIHNLSELNRAWIQWRQTLDQVGTDLESRVAHPLAEILNQTRAWATEFPKTADIVVTGIGTIGLAFSGLAALGSFQTVMNFLGLRSGPTTPTRLAGWAGRGFGAGIRSALSFLARESGPLAFLTTMFHSSPTNTGEDAELDRLYQQTHPGQTRPRHGPAGPPPDTHAVPKPVDPQSQAMAYFTQAGWTPAQAAGIIANMQVETGGTFNPALTNASGHTGIVQWDATRQATIAAHFGKPVSQMSYQEQLEAVNWELRQGGEQAAGTHLAGATSAAGAGAAFTRYYERPGATVDQAAAHRAQIATQLLAQYGQYGGAQNTPPGAPPPDGKAGDAVDAYEQHMHQGPAQVQPFLNQNAGTARVGAQISSWCASFLQSALHAANVQGTGSAIATSYLNWGKKVAAQDVARGDVLVEARGRAAYQTGGHVGIATGRTRMGPRGLQIQMDSGNYAGQVSQSWEDAGGIDVRRATAANASMAPRETGGTNVSNNSSNATVHNVIVNTQSTDSKGISRDIGRDLRNSLAVDANFGMA